MGLYESAITVLAIVSLFLNVYQVYQNNKQRHIDYLRNLQKELRDQKAEYDAWEPVWAAQGEPARHGICLCSMAQSVMIAINDSELYKLAGELKLHAEGHEVVIHNQEILEKATAHLARLLDENWVSKIFRRNKGLFRKSVPNQDAE